MEFIQITVEQFFEQMRGIIALDKLLIMLDEAEHEEHKFGLDENGNPEIDRGLVINHSLATYFISEADIGAYFEKHERPKKPMTAEEENVLLRQKIKELESKLSRKPRKKAPERAKTAAEAKMKKSNPAEVEEPLEEVSHPTAIPPRDEAIPIPEKEEPFTVEDLQKTFNKEVKGKKTISLKSQEAALKKADEKQKKRDELG